MKYDLKKIEALEFESICREIISKIENKEFISYRAGRDGGIDFKYEREQKIIGQAKHYQSSFSSLISTLKEEKIKMDRENPDRYIFMTSFLCHHKMNKKYLKL